MRFCVDYRRLNNVTRKDLPLQILMTLFDSLGGAQYFCALDLAWYCAPLRMPSLNQPYYQTGLTI